MAIANMSRYYGVDYYQGLILPASAGEEEKSVKAAEAARRNKAIKDAAFSCPDIAALPGERSFSLWTTYPGMMMGTGYPHDGGLKGDICAGFSFDYVTGLPYLPGSSVKGILRSAFEHPSYIQELMEDDAIEVAALERALFGERPRDPEQAPSDGKVTFLDVFPSGSCDPVKDSAGKLSYRLLELEAITPHHTDKLGPLAEPNPLTFLKLRPGVELRFRFLCPESVRYGEGMSVSAARLLELFKAILLDLGAGAKTNVGFGSLTDEKPTEKMPVSAQTSPAQKPASAGRSTAQQAVPGQVLCKTCGKPTDLKENGLPQAFCRECRRKHWLETNGSNSPQRR